MCEVFVCLFDGGLILDEMLGYIHRVMNYFAMDKEIIYEEK